MLCLISETLITRTGQPPSGSRYRADFRCEERTSNYLPCAGWSSLVARQAHNLKVAGSNPAPATKSSPIAMAYRVYVLENSESRFYIGLSDDVPRRLREPNKGQSRWTKTRGPWAIVSQSDELSLSEARKLENRLRQQKGGHGLFHLIGVRRSSDP